MSDMFVFLTISNVAFYFIWTRCDLLLCTASVVTMLTNRFDKVQILQSSLKVVVHEWSGILWALIYLSEITGTGMQNMIVGELVKQQCG